MPSFDANAPEVPEARSRGVPAYVDKSILALVAYVAIGAVWMIGGFGGERITHYVGLFADTLPNALTICIAATTARRMEPGPLRRGWQFLTVAFALMLTTGSIGVVSWLRGIDPFPGVADLFSLAFYPVVFVAIYYLMRSAAVRVPWLQIALDGTIFVVGFGAFFWFLV